MSAFNPNDVIAQAECQQWDCTRYDPGQGQLVFLERWLQNDKYELHVWCTTGTVGSYLDHPRQGKTQLYRRNVDWSDLRQILNNPRVHTGTGYHERAELERRQQAAQRERTVACPGCGKLHYTMGDTAQHFESGRCSACPGQDNARRAAFGFVRQQEHRAGAQGAFTNGGQQMLTFNGAGQQDYTAGYESGGYNYNCPGCGKQFRLLSALAQHQQAKPMCAVAHHLALAMR